MPPKLSENETTRDQTLFEKTPLGVFIIDEDGLLLWANKLAMDFLGAAVNIGERICPIEAWPEFRNSILEDKTFYYLADDQGFAIMPQTLSIDNDTQPKYLLRMMPSASLEIDLVGMQQDLIHQRQLANLGKMMVEMAHELNNPLAGISMGLQLTALSLKKLRRLLPEDMANLSSILTILNKLELELCKITESTNRASALRQELLSYSKPSNLNLNPYQFNKLIQSTMSNFEFHPIFREMSLHKKWLKKSPTVLCDASKVEQILYNLLKNAHEATNGKGEVWIQEVKEEDSVGIEFSDNGPGIPEELIDKIFSPFLTTKPRTGSGLGLSISQQIIQQHGGSFSVYNKPQVGACFKMMFPILPES